MQFIVAFYHQNLFCKMKSKMKSIMKEITSYSYMHIPSSAKKNYNTIAKMVVIQATQNITAFTLQIQYAVCIYAS